MATRGSQPQTPLGPNKLWIETTFGVLFCWFALVTHLSMFSRCKTWNWINISAGQLCFCVSESVPENSQMEGSCTFTI